MIEEQISHHTAVRRSLLAKGKTVLIQLDKRGNIVWAAAPLSFDTRLQALDYQRSNKHQFFSLYVPL